jgi:penicillin amidase
MSRHLLCHRTIAALGLILAFAAPAAQASVLRAETMLPPGQSGFVSSLGLATGTGSPHLYDQLAPFIDFRWKPATFNQPGTSETPRAGVQIVRDAYGVPSVTAGSEHDAWWGAGYAAAQDRLFELELFRRASEGRLATLAGSSRIGDDTVVRQDLYRSEELDAMYAALPADLRDRFVAYRDGVNAWISHTRTSPLDLPGEFLVTVGAPAPWSVHDSVALGVYLARTIPTNADPESVELANMRAVQESGPKALDALVPLRTPGAVTSVPRTQGLFPSQPGRTPAMERAARRRSLRYVRTLPFPTHPIDAAGVASGAADAGSRGGKPQPILRLGGSYMFAIRRSSDRHALLFNGPQLGFTAPEKLMELELHAPGMDLRGMTAPGIPLIAAGFNGHVAFGVTTGASDTDDLYAEQLVPGHAEQYVFRGQVRQMDCRTETIAYQNPASGLISFSHPKLPTAGSVKRRFCRTLHGPVEARAGHVAYARRYAAWGLELETLRALAAVDKAKDIREVDRAIRTATWNENLIAADDAGNIGYWHPGLFPLRPTGWDERLPYPGTGQAEWRGLLSRRQIPSAINPRQGWLASWNNLPSAGWTSGDGTARKRLDGAYFRAGRLFSLVGRLAEAPTFAGMEALLHQTGTVAQQFPHARAQLASATRGATGNAATVLGTLLAWDGSYAKTGADGKVDAGVAAWDAFRTAAASIAIAPLGPGARWLADEGALASLHPGYHAGGSYHYFDASHFQSYALRTLTPAGYRAAAAAAFSALQAKYGGAGDPSLWRQPRPMFDFQGLAAASPPPLPFFDRGTYEQLIELGR